MLLLSSGLVVDLSTNRAKYHALRKKHHGPKVKHQDLYPLVDIIIRHRDSSGEIKRCWTEYDYHFSGYTLADIHLIPDWSENDRKALDNWIKQPEQQRHIETARRRLEPFQKKLSTLLNSAPESLYSLLKNRISELPQQHASAKQWLSTINNMQQKGIRKEELDWTNIIPFLKKQNDRVISKNELINTINYSNIRLELSSEQVVDHNGDLYFKEVAKYMTHQAVHRAALNLDEACICILRYVDLISDYRVGLIKTRNNDHHMALNKYWFALDRHGRVINNPETSDHFFGSSDEAIIACNKHRRHHTKTDSGNRFYNRYDYVSLYGGNNYQEWLVSLPDYQRIFFGAHFIDHNVLMHIRTTIRTDDNNRKLLFIEELQSDWHQSGHTHGYDNCAWGKIANAPFKKEWSALATKIMLIHACEKGYDGIAWADGNIQEMRYAKQLQAIKRHYDQEVPACLNKLGKKFNVSVEKARINTRDPWLNLVKTKNKWRVTDGQGKFETRDKYHSRDEAMAVISRHCRSIKLQVPVFYINNKMRKQIIRNGLPLFGETLV